MRMLPMGVPKVGRQGIAIVDRYTPPQIRFLIGGLHFAIKVLIHEIEI